MYSAQARGKMLMCREKEETYWGYFESARSGIIFLDAVLRVKNLNRVAEKIIGIDRNQVLGKYANIAFRRLGDKFQKIFAVSENDDFFSTNVKLRINEQTVYIHVDTLKLRDTNDELGGVIIILQDVSEMRAAIKQIQTTQMLMSLGELAAGVAHHVRTPLTTVSGYLQLMVNRLEDDQYTVRRDVLEMLFDEVSYINNVVKELVLFAKPPIRKEPAVNLSRILEEALQIALKQVGCENIAVNRHMAEDLPAIAADPVLLKRAMVNMIQNAIEAIPFQGTISLGSRIHSEIFMIVVAIADTGVGIAPQMLSRIFEPFYTTKTDRMGLGLPTAHRIISEHGGFINIYSEQDCGTKVHIYLPIIDDCLLYLNKEHQQVLNLQ